MPAIVAEMQTQGYYAHLTWPSHQSSRSSRFWVSSRITSTVMVVRQEVLRCCVYLLVCVDAQGLIISGMLGRKGGRAAYQR